MVVLCGFLPSNLTQERVGTHPGSSDPPTLPPHYDFLNTILQPEHRASPRDKTTEVDGRDGYGELVAVGEQFAGCFPW